MSEMKFNRELYSKIALIKAAYNFTDIAYLHLDADCDYYYVKLEPKEGYTDVSCSDFENEILTQSVRHEVYMQTKNIRELLLARAVATSILAPKEYEEKEHLSIEEFTEDEILKEWFLNNENK